ncbi:MAG: polysaccharide deacetylase family protein [Planctomycetota bacterium]
MRAIEYVLSVLLREDDRALIPAEKKVVYTFDSIEGPCVQIIPSGFFNDGTYGTPKSLPSLPLKEIEGVPLLFGSPRVERKGNRLVVYADIIASTFFLVTRYEEVIRRNVRDKYGRFPGKESLPYRANFIHRPIVEEYAAILRKWLRNIGLNVKEPSRKFSVLLTHDMDEICKYVRFSQPLRQVAKAFLGREPFGSIIESLLVPLGLKEDPYHPDKLLKLDRSIGHITHSCKKQSIFFFMSNGSEYKIHKKSVRNIIKRLHESGAILGLHSSLQAGYNPELIGKEKSALEQACGFPILHNRHHYLLWREVEDGWALAKAGIKWDSTLGYADVAGFRLGVCHPIELFDPIRMEPFGIEEHPLIIMDVTLSGPNCMNLDKNQALKYCLQLADQVRKHKGEFVVLWHNDKFQCIPNNYHPDLYIALLDELSSS